MIEPENDQPLHEMVRQQLAGYHPPFDPANWQRMRRKLRRERWRLVGWWATGLVLLLGIGWYGLTVRPLPPVAGQSVGIGQKTVGTTSVISTVEPVHIAIRTIKTPVRNGKVSRTIWPEGALTAPAARGGIQPLEPHLVPGSVGNIPVLPPVLVHSPAEPDIIRQVLTGAIGADSTTYRVLARNLKRWPNAVVVCDFTSSMYPYSTQLMTWLRNNQTNTQVQGIVFFTDCDSLGRETAPGQSGQLYATRSRTVANVLPLMLASARNTMGNVDNAENNIAPLVYAQHQFPDASHLILIADNSSAVKDLNRLPELHKPVHIILCGPTFDTTQAFQPDYYAIARQTGGSLHTGDDDLTNVGQLRLNTWIQVDQRYYRFNRRGHFVGTRFRHRPRRLFGLFWH